MAAWKGALRNLSTHHRFRRGEAVPRPCFPRSLVSKLIPNWHTASSEGVQPEVVALRRSLRLAHHDYRSSGGYFVTICAARRGDVFGTLLEESVALNETGEIVNKHLRERVDRAEGVAVDAAIVMPDHVHVVVMLEDGGRTLSSLVGAFKSSTAREVKRRCPSVAHPVWQRGFYDHVVRNDADLDRVRDYIATNPLRSSLRRSG